MEPVFLDLDEVMAIHQDQIERHGGSLGVRDMGALQSALAMPQAGAFGEYFHADLFEMAAAYLFHIAKNHPFVDGNKRAGVAAALVFLKVNGVNADIPNKALADMVLSVAEGKTDKAKLTLFLRKYGGK